MAMDPYHVLECTGRMSSHHLDNPLGERGGVKDIGVAALSVLLSRKDVVSAKFNYGG